jgi:hypothetical protein
MRKWFVIFMLFLLPIRGLVGDAMAYSMPTNATDSVAARAVSTDSGDVFTIQITIKTAPSHPCHTEDAATGDTTPVQNQCTTCQACHFSAAPVQQWTGALLHPTTAAPSQRAALWHSADARLLAKTPVF